jgi:hypothetical protein
VLTVRLMKVFLGVSSREVLLDWFGGNIPLDSTGIGLRRPVQ